jgi:hypothetical protein
VQGLADERPVEVARRDLRIAHLRPVSARAGLLVRASLRRDPRALDVDVGGEGAVADRAESDPARVDAREREARAEVGEERAAGVAEADGGIRARGPDGSRQAPAQVRRAGDARMERTGHRSVSTAASPETPNA